MAIVWSIVQPGDAAINTSDFLLRNRVLFGGPTPPIGARIVLVRSSYPTDPLWPGGGPWDTVRAIGIGGCQGLVQDSPAAWASVSPCPVEWEIDSTTQIVVGFSDAATTSVLLTAPLGTPALRRVHLGWLLPE